MRMELVGDGWMDGFENGMREGEEGKAKAKAKG